MRLCFDGAVLYLLTEGALTEGDLEINVLPVGKQSVNQPLQLHLPL